MYDRSYILAKEIQFACQLQKSHPLPNPNATQPRGS